jgi:hypothetical protein
MAGNGASGFMEGFIQGMPAGNMLANRIAQARSDSRMQAVQDAIDAGKYTNDAAGQAQLQADLRNAQAPLSNRGMDDSYGEDQYSRLLGLQKLRAAQQAGSSVPASAPGADGASSLPPDYSGALSGYATNLRGLGDLQRGMQADQMSGQITAGRNAINQTGQMSPTGTQPGEVDQARLGAGVAANNAAMGDASGSAQWGDRAKQQGDTQLQGMLGRALTMAQNPSLGGMQGAAPFLNSAAQMMGYGQVQYSPSQDSLTVMSRDNQPLATINQQNIQQFAETLGNQPENLIGNLRALQTQQYQAATKQRPDDYNAGRDTLLGLAKSAPSDAMLNQAERIAVSSGTAAEKTGWKTLSSTPVTDKDGAPTGVVRSIVQPPGSPPLILTVMPADPSKPAQQAYRLQRQDGTDVSGNELGQYAASAQVVAQAARDRAMLDNLKLNQARFQQGRANVYDVLGSLGSGAFGGSMPQGGQLPPPHAITSAQVQVESGGNQNAVSPKGAVGVMQLMPGTAREQEQKLGLPPGSTDTSAAANTKAGEAYRQQLVARYTKQSGNEFTGLAQGLIAYNMGPDKTDKWLAAGADPAKLPKETREYVTKVFSKLGLPGMTAARGSSGIMGASAGPKLPKVKLNAAGTAPLTSAPTTKLSNGPANKYLL